jgi:hypothetical protein
MRQRRTCGAALSTKMSTMMSAMLGACLVAGGAPGAEIRLVDITAASDLSFRHDAAKSPEKQLPETMGSGLALLDHDGDSDLDLYFVQGRSALGESADSRSNELWRNDGNWRFTRVEDAAGASDRGLGMGACVGDVDGDGDPDLFVTNVGPDVLFVGEAGRFQRRTADFASREDWSSSCTFFDADGDSDLDLYVVAYTDWHPAENNPFCGQVEPELRAYCHPHVFKGVRDTLWINNGSGHFQDETVARGLGASDGKGLGVVLFDPDQDGDSDLFVANDSTPNFYWQNVGGRFEERALRAGLAFDERGDALACMGIAHGDVDGDGRDDLLVTNLDHQDNTLYSARGAGRFRDATAASGIPIVDRGLVGFGADFFDADFDGDLDLFLANGHIIDNISQFKQGLQHAQPDQLLLNDGHGRFQLHAADPGELGSALDVSRGSALGDLDGDGDLDLVVSQNDGPARLYRNDGAEALPHLVLRLRGTKSNRDALGARVQILAPGKHRVLSGHLVLGGRSYLSQGTADLHVACPPGGADVQVTWPSGRREIFPARSPARLHVLVEGQGQGDAQSAD